jgi:hypothetical protein
MLWDLADMVGSKWFAVSSVLQELVNGWSKLVVFDSKSI